MPFYTKDFAPYGCYGSHGAFCMQSCAGKGMALVRLIFFDIADVFADVTPLYFKRRGHSPQYSTFHLAECLQVW